MTRVAQYQASLDERAYLIAKGFINAKLESQNVILRKYGLRPHLEGFKDMIDGCEAKTLELFRRKMTMSFPKNQSEQLIIVILGKTGKYLSGSQLHDYAEDKKVCSKNSLPTLQTFYNAIKSLNTNNIIKKMGESRKNNFNEDSWGLTPSGESIYENISKLYSILDYVPNWDDIITHCINCKQNREKCFEDYKVDLENVLKENYNFNERYDIPSWKINNLFNSPKNIQEFLFWLLLLKESQKRLMKFKKQLDALEISIE